LSLLANLLAGALSISPAAQAQADTPDEAARHFIEVLRKDPRAAEVIVRTRRPTGTYALYQWQEIADNLAAGRSEWAAEFHSGTMHRVETPQVRVVADCATMAGFVYDVSKGQSRADPAVGLGACGINLGRIPTLVEYIRKEPSKFGNLDMVHIVDSTDDRYYGISDQGVIITTEYVSRAEPGRCLQGSTLQLADNLPEQDIFTEASLSRSVVPERFREAPTSRAAVGYSGRTCRNPSQK
jgi:hypothetical protein